MIDKSGYDLISYVIIITFIEKIHIRISMYFKNIVQLSTLVFGNFLPNIMPVFLGLGLGSFV